MFSDVCISSNEAEIGTVVCSCDALSSYSGESIKVASRSCAVKYCLVKLLCKSERQSCYELVIESGCISSELVGEWYDNCELVSLHYFLVERRVLDRLYTCLSYPFCFGVTCDDRNCKTVTRKDDLSCELHYCGLLLRLLKDLAGYFGWQVDMCSVCCYACCHSFYPFFIRSCC